MIFSPTAKFLTYANAAVKTFAWKLYVKKTTDITESLASGTWIDATAYAEEIPDQHKRIEYEFGQFVSDAVDIRGRNIAWWDANVFNATASQYIEAKIQFVLGQGDDLCSDTVYTFCGFVDKTGRRYSESADSVDFTIYTVQDLGQRIAAENLTAQYIDTDIDGIGTDGLALPQVPRLFVKDAALAGNVLKSGSHTIVYDYNSGTPRARLDDGEYVSLSNGDNTLSNGASDQQVKLYTVDITKLPKAGAEIEENVVVTVEGDTLPRQWYRYVGVPFLLGKIFTLLGITSQTITQTQMPTWNASSRISYLDAPPGDGLITAYKYAMISDGTDLWIGVGNKLYKRTMSSGVYELKATLTAGRIITRLWHSSGNGHIWVYFQTSLTNINGHILRHTISGGANSSEIALTGASRYCIELYDAYTWYGIVYGDMTNHTLRGIQSSSMTDALLLSQAGLGYSGTEGPDGNLGFMRNGTHFIMQTSDPSNSYLFSVYYNNLVPEWDSIGEVLTLTTAYQVGAYHTSEDRIYFYDASTNKIKSHTYSSATETDVLTLAAGGEIIESMVYVNGKVYVTTPKFGYLYQIVSNAATVLNSDGPRIYTIFYAFAWIDRLYGLDEAGRLYQLHTTLAFYMPLARFDGDTLTGALNRILGAFMMVATISSAKAVHAYLRGDGSGDPETTGETLSITVSEASDIDRVVKYIEAAGIVEVSNVNTRITYNGTAYNTESLSDVRRVTISSDLIPDEIVKDLVKHAYLFFSTDRDLYRFPLGQLPLFQFEPFDECQVTFTTTKIQKSATGVIYGVALHNDGSMTVEGLI